MSVFVNGVNLTLIGLNDAADYHAKYVYDHVAVADAYKILLAHRPEKWPEYIADVHAVKPDLTLSGHAHGGQFRVFGQGIAAPDQGLFPKFDAGLYTAETGERLVVSRGIGNSLFPYRFNNPPHVPVITVTA